MELDRSVAIRRWGLLCCLAFAWVCISANAAPERDTSSVVTQVVMLGTGTPNPDPSRSGPSVAIVVNGTPYLVDFGPGVMRQAASLSPAYGGVIEALAVRNIRHAFLTHLHSDHAMGFADLVFTPWIFGRNQPLELFGPSGTASMANEVLSAYKEDIHNRINGLEAANDKGWRVNTHEFRAGEIYRDDNVRVEAFKAQHGSWDNAFGFRFTTPDRVIVISGDTAPNAEIEKHSRDADILIHEAYSATGIQSSGDAWRKYMRVNHSSGPEVAALASKIRPGLLVLTHVLFLGATKAQMIAEVKQNYDGAVVLAEDLDVY